MKKTVRRLLSLMLAAACAVSVVASANPTEVSAKNNYKKGDYITFGNYEQDGNTSNGAEPIEWEVLTVKNGKALVISKYILDSKPYNETWDNVTWEICTLRKWLNKDFYDSAFNDSEKNKIVNTKISNPDNKIDGTDGGKATKDNVFLLSVSEIQKYYKIKKWNKDYMRSYLQALMTEGTQYATDNGLFTYTMTKADYNEYYNSEGYKKNCIGRTCGDWWLRSPGSAGIAACDVRVDGLVGWGSCGGVASDITGVRPAMWIKL